MSFTVLGTRLQATSHSTTTSRPTTVSKHALKDTTATSPTTTGVFAPSNAREQTTSETTPASYVSTLVPHLTTPTPPMTPGATLTMTVVSKHARLDGSHRLRSIGRVWRRVRP